MSLQVHADGPVWTVIIDRPQKRNAIDRETAQALADAFRAFDQDAEARVAVLTGSGGAFCAGADLHAVAEGRGNRVEPDGDGPLGPTRMSLDKPVLAAIEGPAVAGGLELACWCDMRVAAASATFGVLCRRFGVPLIDGGTIRLPRLIGQSHAMDLILTGRSISASEAWRMGLVNRIVPDGTALTAARELAAQLADLPQRALRADRRSACDQWSLPLDEALQHELQCGLPALTEGVRGAMQFASGAGRHGQDS